MRATRGAGAPSGVMGDEGNWLNGCDRGQGRPPSHPVVKGPPRHLPFRSKWSLQKRTGFLHNRGLMCNM
jgi:hypothetical protein